MKAFLARVPVAAGCLALGFIGLGALLASWSVAFLYFFGVLSTVLVIIVICKLLCPGELKAAIEDPLQLSSLAGTPMAVMLLSAQLATGFELPGALYLWVAAVICHLLIIVIFSLRYLLRCRKLKDIHGSWLLVYAGISAAAVAAPAFGLQTLALSLLALGGLGTVGLLPVVYLRYIKCPDIPAPAAPLFCITAAPVSLWLSGCLKTAPEIPAELALAIAVVTAFLYVPALLRCLGLFTKGFFPSFAAFTFPFVINATAMNLTSKLFSGEALFSLLYAAAVTESVIALCLCLTAGFMYIRYLFPVKAKA